MPHFRIETNVPKSKIPHDFVTKTVPVLAKALGKPESYCVVTVIPDLLMSFGGTTEPCAIANLMSIGALGVEQNKKHSKVLFELVEKELGVSHDRMYITFQDEPTGNVGFKGTTFHSIFG
ncbi:macrophage migration inhibitory factor-like [Pieris napi]|uniref:macrophage migration inhibitory factor-like n=1 Tax=Pieris napi TaxID=78633 RepID=UPI001FBBCC87|nr:macrophage migration inhibitory factor-like [Pieris napi]XP_047520591.1 macrophage migration inhibitory factor-like [Pieris napi]